MGLSTTGPAASPKPGTDTTSKSSGGPAWQQGIQRYFTATKLMLGTTGHRNRGPEKGEMVEQRASLRP